MIEDVIDDLPEVLGISPVQKHGKCTKLRLLQMNNKLDRVKDCLKVMHKF